MKISESWQKGKMIDGFPFIECDPENPIIFINHKKKDFLGMPKIGRIKKLNNTDFMLLSERVRIRDFSVIDVYNLDYEWAEIFQRDNDFKIQLSIAFEAIVKLGLARYKIQIAIYGLKSCPIDDLGRASLEQIGKDSIVLDWQIISKEINYPSDYYDGYFGDDEIILDPENSLAKAMIEAIPYDAIAA